MSHKKLVLIIVVVLMLAAIGFGKIFFFSAPSAPAAPQGSASLPVASGTTPTPTSPTLPPPGASSSSPSSTANASIPAVMQATSQLFVDFPNASHGYEVWPVFTSAKAQQALDGFTLNAQDLGNNIYKIDIVPKVANYKTQSFVVTGDSKIYFIETSFGDDETDQDYAYGDDAAVAVNAAGYVLK